MTPEVWLAIIACIGSGIALIKYGLTLIDKSNDKAIQAHSNHLQSFKEDILIVRKEYYDTVAKINQLKIQLHLSQKSLDANNLQLVKFIELTKKYVEDSEKRLKILEDNFGKVILK